MMTTVALSPDHLLGSGDRNGNIQVWQLIRFPSQTVRISTPILKTLATQPVQQILISPGEEFVLISTIMFNSVYSLQNGTCTGKF